MHVEFDDDELAHVETDPDATAGLSQALVRAFRRRMQSIRAAPDERQFYANRGMHFKQCQGKRRHQHEIRLNDQYRLIVELIGKGSDKVVRVIEVADIH